MLTIRAQQMQALADAQTRRFRSRLRAHLGHAMAADDDTEQQLDRCIAASAAFGLHAACDIARFAELTWRYAGCYPVKPLPKPALAILLAHGLAPARKLARYADWVDSMTTAEKAHG
jgi:hypothetical protein